MNATHDLKTHTAVTVTTDPDPMQQSLEIRLNIGYFKQLPGIIKLVQLVSYLKLTDLYMQMQIEHPCTFS